MKGVIKGEIISIGLVIFLVALGGCSSSTPTRSPTVSPAPISTPSLESSESAPSPPGIDHRGLRNASRLAANHARVLQGAAFIQRTSLHIEFPKGTVRAGTEEVLRMGANDTTFSYTEKRLGTWSDEPGERELLSIRSNIEGIHRTVRFVNGTILNSTVSVERIERLNEIHRPAGERMVAFLRAVNAESVSKRTTSSDETIFEIIDTDISPNLLPLFLNPHGTAELRAVVLDSGLVKSLEVSYEFQRENETLHFRWRTEFQTVPSIRQRPKPDP